MKKTKMFSGFIGIAAAMSGQTAGADAATPTSIAAAFVTARQVEMGTQDVQLLHGFAAKLAHQARTLAQANGALGQQIQTTVPCESGSATIASAGDTLSWLRVTYDSCVTHEANLEITHRGPITLTLLQVPDADSRIIAVRIGDPDVDFIEERQFDPAPPDALAPSRSTLNFKIAGDLLSWNEINSAMDRDYHYVIDGSFSEENHSYTWNFGEQITRWTIDGDKLLVRGSQRSVTGDAPKLITNWHAPSGVLIRDYSEEVVGEAFTFGRTSQRFDDFRVRRVEHFTTGAIDVSYDGLVDVDWPEWVSPACTRGSLRLETEQAIREMGQDSQDFTRGVLQANGGTIRFSRIDPRVTISAPGFAPVTLDSSSLFAYAGCFF